MPLAQNLQLLQTNLINKTLTLSPYTFFTINDPKKRIICAASFSDRVLHHAIMNVAEKIFEKMQIYDSYACRKGKGTYKAVLRTFYFAKKYDYFIKLDMKKYFDSISHKKLKELLELKFGDRDLLQLFYIIIDSYHVTENCGIPIGNLTSQFFANYYLSFFDHFAKEILKVKGYVRYMDDIILFCSTPLERKKIVENSTTFLEKKLLLKVKYAIQSSTKDGVPFLGFLITSKKIQAQQKKKKRIKQKIKQYTYYLKQNLWSEKEIAFHILPLFAYRKVCKNSV